ncbi:MULTISPECIES: phage tail tape measure protein [unclassified Pseudomonas]|uniref:phage tail tape measure protein n=1 Tax=unclassified Pseudomonas TaxID=196821 RepID=UPI0021BB313F|nr:MULTISPECIES: phage tail tape measure protein [unclassified Pseudomonas]MCT8165620.1 phage tail tape measure protein [Pseudomonas sp. HD6422]MCT8183630.1 phage tail tape measure protein [Pseudomonas sp. HD6421]
MTTIAELGIRVDSGDAVGAAADLDRLVDAGSRAEKAAAGVEQSAKKAGQALKEQAGDVSALLGEIDPTTKALGRLDDLEKRLSQQRKLGNLDPSTFNEYRSKIQQSRDDLSRFDEALGRTGVSAKQTAAAMRMLPAQFSDIFVSLQGGQAPLTVFLQQGAQIKDSFGGIGAATKAMGGYLLELVNPATVSAAAIAGLGYAFYDAQREIGAFSRAIFTGVNRSGQTVDSLNQIATTVGKVTGSFGGARDAVISLSSGLAGSSTQIRNLASAAVAISEITGKGVEDVASALEKSGKNATDSAAKISEQYGLLTFEQYEFIKALDDQGEHQRALDVLSEDLNTAAQERLRKYRESLSDIEKDWKSIKKAISNAYAAVKAEIAPNEAQQVDIARRILERRQEGGFLGSLSNLFSFGDNSTQSLKKLVLTSEERAQAAERETQAQTELSNANRDLIRISRELDSQLDNVSPANKRADAYKKLNEQFFELMSAAARSGKESPLLEGVQYDGKKFSGGAYDILAAGIETRLKDKRTPTYREDAGTKALDQARQQYSVLQQQNTLIGAQVGEVQKLGEAGQALVKWEQQLADIKDEKTLTADQKSLLANQDLITAQLKRNAALEREMQLRKVATEEAQKLSAFETNLNNQLQRDSVGLSNDLAGMGLGDVARQRMQERFSIEQRYQQQMDNLQQQRNEGRVSESLYQRENAALQDSLDKRLAMQEKYYGDLDTAQADWSIGARAAWANYQEQAMNVAGQMQTAFTSLYDGLTDAAVEWAFGADETFGDVAVSFGKMLAKMALQAAASSVFSSIFGTVATGLIGASVGSAASAGTAGGGFDFGLGSASAGMSYTPTFSDGGYTGPGGKYEPAGIVHRDEFVMRKEIVQQPGMLEFLDSLNTKGYADGGLVGSVTARPIPSQISAAGGSNSVVVQQEISVDGGGGQAGGGSGDMSAVAQAYAKAAKDGAQQEIAKQLKRGGMIWTAINRPMR